MKRFGYIPPLFSLSISLSLLCTIAILCACENRPPPRYDQENFSYTPANRIDPNDVDNQNDQSMSSSMENDQEVILENDMLIDMEVPLDAAMFSPIPFAVETRVGERFTVAGLENRVTCQLLNQQGEAIAQSNLQLEITPSQGFVRSQNGLIGEVARTYEIKCLAPLEGLVDSTPAIWTVMPAEPVLALTQIEPVEIQSGDLAEISCQAFDAYGNETQTEWIQKIEPEGIDINRVGASWRVDRSGTYQAMCLSSGIEDVRSATLSVLPGEASQLDMILQPDLPIYRVGQIVEISPLLRDRRGNVLSNHEVIVSSDPVLPGFGTRRVRLDRQGSFELSARYARSEEDVDDLISTKEILVDQGGAGIRCLSPDLGEWVYATEGDTIRLSGKISDTVGVQSIHVDGMAVDFDNEGNFQVDVTTEWGLNIHTIQVQDEQGESSAFCTYFASENFLSEENALTSALTLVLGQDFIDDGPPNQPIASLADVLRRVINSAGLRDTVHQSASAQNPIVPSECRTRVLGICIFRLGVDYSDFAISRDNQLTVTLLDRGLRIRIELRDIAVSARLRGTLGNRVRISTSGIVIDFSFNMGLGINHQADVNVRSINEVRVNELDSDFSGFITGFILELVFDAFEGLIRDTITDAIRGFLESELDRTLTGLFSNIGVGALGSGLTVNPPVGESIEIQLIALLDQLMVNPSGILLGVSTRFDGPLRLGAAASGTPLIPSQMLMMNEQSIQSEIQLGVLNQALTQLWRSGFFDIQDQGLVDSLTDSLPIGSEVRLSLPYPPFVEGEEGSNTLKIGLGPLTASVIYPGLFDEAFAVQLVARLSTSVLLEGERTLNFSDVTIDDIHFSLGSDVPLAARERLNTIIQSVLQRVVDEALNQSMPSIPLPELNIPPGLEHLDLPSTIKLGLRSPLLFGSRDRWQLSGTFSE